MKATSIHTKGTITMIIGIFNGSEMLVDKGPSYPVPYNYASKSRLIPGDTLKLTVYEDGSMIYKLIKSAPRKNIKGILHRKDNQYLALGSDNNNYNLNSAAVTFHKGQCGDEVCLVINETGVYNYAALELVLKQ